MQPGGDRVYAAEHGPAVDDEVNLVQPRGNYGWDPNRGGEYNQDVPMTDTRAFPDAVTPVWSSGAPTLAPGGMTFLDDPAWEWDGAMAVAMLATSQIVLMKLSPTATRSRHGDTAARRARPDAIRHGGAGWLAAGEPPTAAPTRSCGSARRRATAADYSPRHDYSRRTARAASASASA